MSTNLPMFLPNYLKVLHQGSCSIVFDCLPNTHAATPRHPEQACGLWDMQQLGGVCQLWVHQLLGGDERGHLRVHMQGIQGGGEISRIS